MVWMIVGLKDVELPQSLSCFPAKVLQTIFASVYKAGFESGRCDAEYRQMQGLVQLIPGLERFVTDLAEQVADKVIDQRMNTSQYQ
jgi:hypothetical protein